MIVLVLFVDIFVNYFFSHRRRQTNPGDHCYIQPSTSSGARAESTTSNYDEDSSSSEPAAPATGRSREAKYRRMRDLNNLASKRCRQNRKRKFQDLLDEEERLRARNAELRMKCRNMEDLVAGLKRKFIDKVTNPAGTARREPVDLDDLMSQRLDAL